MGDKIRNTLHVNDFPTNTRACVARCAANLFAGARI
jgi:hypothetical protein